MKTIILKKVSGPMFAPFFVIILLRIHFINLTFQKNVIEDSMFAMRFFAFSDFLRSATLSQQKIILLSFVNADS